MCAHIHTATDGRALHLELGRGMRRGEQQCAQARPARKVRRRREGDGPAARVHARGVEHHRRVVVEEVARLPKQGTEEAIGGGIHQSVDATHPHPVHSNVLRQQLLSQQQLPMFEAVPIQAGVEASLHLCVHARVCGHI